MGEAWTPAPFGGRIAATQPAILGDRRRSASGRERARGWTRFRDWLDAMVERGVSPNVGSFLGGGTLREYAKGMEMGRRRRRAGDDAPGDGRGDGGRRVRRRLRADLPARRLRRRRRDRRDLQGRRTSTAASTSPTSAPRPTADSRRSTRRSTIGRRSGVRGRDLPPQGVRAAQLAADAGRHRAHRRRPRRRPRHHRRHVPLHRQRHRPLDRSCRRGLAADGKFYDNLRDPEMRAKIRAEVLQPRRRLGGAWATRPGRRASCRSASSGRRTSTTSGAASPRSPPSAASTGSTPSSTCWSPRSSASAPIYFMMSEENLALQLQQPWIKVCTDAGGLDPAWADAARPDPPARLRHLPARPRQVRPRGGRAPAGRRRPQDDLGRRRPARPARPRPAARRHAAPTSSSSIRPRSPTAPPSSDPTNSRSASATSGSTAPASSRDGEHTGATPGRFVKGPGRDEFPC